MFRNMFRGVNRSLKMVQKGILIFAVFVTIFQLFNYFMNKDKLHLPARNFDHMKNEFYSVVNDPELTKTEFGKQQVTIYRVIMCVTIGETCTDNPEESDQYYQKSLMGRASSLIVRPYAHPPASGIIWSYESLANAGFISDANAQGIGFFALQPLAPIWKVFRNIAYMLIVLVMVSIGFMIMFRSNISAQTVISIESALPRIVIALLLITFSFPIAGFMIDIMYIVMGLGGSLIIENIAISSGNPGQAAHMATILGWEDDIFNQTGWNLFGKILGKGSIWYTGSAILSLVPWELQSILRYIVAGGAVALYAGLHPAFNDIRQGRPFNSIPFIGEFAGFTAGGIINSIIIMFVAGLFMPILLSFVVWVSCLFLFFRIFFMLLMTYTRILLTVIFSPFILLFEAFPGTSTFGYWFKGLAFNLLTFPIVAVLIMTSGMIANVSQLTMLNAGFKDGLGNVLVNPANNFWQPPFLYSVEADGFVMLVAISILFIIPDVVAYLKKMFGVEDLPFNVTPATLLGSAGMIAGGVMGLAGRSRALSREANFFRDTQATGLRKLFNPFLAENESDKWKEILGSRESQTSTSKG